MNKVNSFLVAAGICCLLTLVTQFSETKISSIELLLVLIILWKLINKEVRG